MTKSSITTVSKSSIIDNFVISDDEEEDSNITSKTNDMKVNTSSSIIETDSSFVTQVQELKQLLPKLSEDHASFVVGNFACNDDVQIVISKS